MESQRSRVRRDRCILSNASNRRHRQQIQIRACGWARTARRPRTADGDPSGLLRNVPPPQERWPRASGGSERAGKGAETTQPASRMIRSAVTLTRDLVRRRHPIGASPSRRNAPGRTLSPMPSEQKGAYGGHLALPSFDMERTSLRRPVWSLRTVYRSEGTHRPFLHTTADGSQSVQPYLGRPESDSSESRTWPIGGTMQTGHSRTVWKPFSWRKRVHAAIP